MNFGKRTPHAESNAVVARAWERGVRLFDTANVYSDGESERILGRALEGKVGALVATKVGLMRVGGRAEGLAPERIGKAIDESLERLGRETIDLYYLHAPDPATPIERTVEAMAMLADKGKIRRWGVSNYAAWQILESDHFCEAAHFPAPSVSQVLYNLLVRQLDIEYFAFARKHPIHTTVYNALAGGLLSGRYVDPEEIERGSRFDGNTMYQRRYWSQPMFVRVERLRALAAEAGRSLISLAYGWLAAHPSVDSILVGPATVAQLDAALDGIDRPLDESTCRAIDALHSEARGTDAKYAR
jgi:aryl-alcohol dehydrogenase-like predicted oxidoreductase